MSVFRGWRDASKSYEAFYDRDNMPQKMDLNHVAELPSLPILREISRFLIR